MAFLANRRSSPKIARGLGNGFVFVRILELALDERTQPLFKEVHRFSDTFVIGDGHGLLLTEQLSLRLRLARCRAPGG